METLNIKSGVKRVAINGDENRVIEFNPSDMLFVERFDMLYDDVLKKNSEYQARAKELDRQDAVNDDGVPVNISQRIQLLTELCRYLDGKIDEIFGEGTAQMVFEGYVELDMYVQFFEGMTNFMETERKRKTKKYTEQYTTAASAKRNRRKSTK